MQGIYACEAFYVLGALSFAVHTVLWDRESLEELPVGVVRFPCVLLYLRITSTLKNEFVVVFVHRLVYYIYMWKNNVRLSPFSDW